MFLSQQCLFSSESQKAVMVRITWTFNLIRHTFCISWYGNITAKFKFYCTWIISKWESIVLWGSEYPFATTSILLPNLSFIISKWESIVLWGSEYLFATTSILLQARFTLLVLFHHGLLTELLKCCNSVLHLRQLSRGNGLPSLLQNCKQAVKSPVYGSVQRHIFTLT